MWIAVLALLQLGSPAHATYKSAWEIGAIDRLSRYLHGHAPSDQERLEIAGFRQTSAPQKIVDYLNHYWRFGYNHYLSESMFALLWMQADEFIDEEDLAAAFRRQLRRPWYGDYRYETKYIPDEKPEFQFQRHPSDLLIRGLRYIKIDSPSLREKVKRAILKAEASDYILKAVPGLAIQLGYDMVGREFETDIDIPHLRETLHLRIVSILRDFKAAPGLGKLSQLEWALRYASKLSLRDDALADLAEEWVNVQNFSWKFRTLRPFLTKKVAEAAVALSETSTSSSAEPRPKTPPEVIESGLKSYIGRDRTNSTLELNKLIAQHNLLDQSPQGRQLRYSVSALKERIQMISKQILNQKKALDHEMKNWEMLQEQLDATATLPERQQLLIFRKEAKASLQKVHGAVENLESELESAQAELDYMNGTPGAKIEKLTSAEIQALQLTEVTESQTPHERALELGQRMRTLLRERELVTTEAIANNTKEILVTLLALFLDNDHKAMTSIFLKQFKADLLPDALKGWNAVAKIHALIAAINDPRKRLTSTECSKALGS